MTALYVVSGQMSQRTLPNACTADCRPRRRRRILQVLMKLLAQHVMLAGRHANADYGVTLTKQARCSHGDRDAKRHNTCMQMWEGSVDVVWQLCGVNA